MNKLGAFLTVLFAPLIGAIISLTWDGFDGDFIMIGIGWVVALILTIISGLPTGFAAFFVMEKFNFEGLPHYFLVGAGLGWLLPLAVLGRTLDLLYPSAPVVGALLGLGFWIFVRRPVLQEAAA